MVSKNNRKLLLERDRDEKQRFSIRKLSIGAASVLVGLTFSAYSGQTAHAATEAAPTTVKTDTSSDAGKEQVSTKDTSTETKSTETTDKTVDQGQANVKQVKPVVLAAQTTILSSAPTTSTTSAPTTSTTSAPTTSSTTATEETVSDQAGFIAALKKDNLSTIKVAKDISLAGYTGDKTGIHVGDKKSHDITITSADDQKHKLDFNDNWLVDGYNVTFENLDLYDNTVKGLVQGAQSVTFNNVDFHGDTLINTAGNTTVNFKGTVNAQTANSYKFDDTHTYNHTDYTLGTDGTVTKGTQQTTDGDSLVSVGGTVNFEEGSNVTLSTASGHVIQVHKSSSNPVGTVHVKQNSTVVLNPHTMDTVSDTTSQSATPIAYGIYDGGETDQGLGSSLLDIQGNLTINLKKGDNDQKLSGGIYGFGDHTNGDKTGVKIANGGKLDVEFDGQGATLPDNSDLNLFNTINSIAIGDNSSFAVNAKDMGTYSGTLVQGTDFNIEHDTHVTITADGSGNIIGASGLTFTNPAEVNIDLTKNTGANSKALSNSQIDMAYGRTKWNSTMDSAIVKDTSMTFDGSGTPNVSKQEVFSDEGNDTNANDEYTKEVYFVAESTADDTKIVSDTIQAPDASTEKLVGHVTASSGNENIFVNVTISGVTDTIEDASATLHHYNVKDNGAEQDQTTKFAAKTDRDGNFTIDLSKWKTQIDGGATITINAQTMDGHKATPVTLTVTNVKEDAKKQVKAEADKVTEAIKKLTSLDSEAQSQATSLVNTEVTTANQEIDEAPLEGLQDTVKQFILQIDQDGASAAIDNEVEAIKKEVTDLSKDETAALSTAATTAKNNIKAVTDNTKVAATQEAGILALDKLGATDAIEHAVTKAETTISASKASETDKTAAKNKVEKDKTEIEKQISDANTVEAVNNAKVAGLTLIQTDSTVTETPNRNNEKTTAKQAIKTEADKIVAEINGMKYLNPSEKTLYTSSINDIVSQANTNITNLQDNSTDFTSQLQSIENQAILPIDQIDAIAEVYNEAAKIEEENPYLSAEEKDDLKAMPQKAQDLINHSAQQDLATAKATALLSLDKIDVLAKFDHAAEDAINKANAGQDPNKAQIVEKLKDDKQKFDDQINKAETASDLQSVQTQGLAQIQTDSQPTKPVDHSKEKYAAKQAIKAEADKVTDEIGKKSALSQDARTSYLNDVKHIADSVDADLNTLDNNDPNFDTALKTKQNSLILAIDKDEAKAQIDNEVATVEQENPDLSSEEKQALEDSAKDAKNSITTSAGKPDVSATILAIDKLGAKDAIAHAITNAEMAINTSDASESEKKAATDKLQGEKDALEKTIDAATTQDAVKAAKTKALAQIQTDSKVDNSVSQAQKAAKDELKAEADKVKKDIDSQSDLSEADKTAAKQVVENDESQAEAKIDAANDQNGIDTAKNDGKIQIDRDGATSVIDNQVAKTTKDISNLTDSEQQAAKDQIQKDAQAAKEKIKAATADTIKSVQDAGILLIVQDGANAEIDHEAAQVKTAIDGLKGLTPEQIATAKQKVDTDTETAKADVKKATTPEEVKTAQIQGIALLEKDKTVDAKSDDTKTDDNKSDNNDQPTTPTDDKNDSKDDQSQTDSNDNNNASDNNNANNSQSTNSQNGQIDSGTAIDNQSPATPSDNNDTNQAAISDTSSKGLATDPGNIKLASAKGANQVMSRTKRANAKSELPQAGAKREEALVAIGLAIATAGSWLGLGINKKRREK